MPQKLKNFICIITGGTGFLGREIIAEFLQNGATVFTNYRDEQKYSDLKSYFGDYQNLVGVHNDLISEAQVNDFFRRFSDSYQRLDVFIHTMGGFWMGQDVSSTPFDKWNHMMNLNLNSTFLCTREAFRIMKAQCSGKIFTISARPAIDLPAGMAAYAVSKSGVLALTEIIAKEGKEFDIQANSIIPGVIDTAANRKSMPDADFSKWVTPKDIARVLINLSQPEVRHLSQTAIKIFGKI
ncbi:MAG: SDR family NAD(P)-dependent oxidoreductase [Calditrichia bacterium]